MNLKTSDIKIPGVLWVLLIGVVVVVAELYGVEPAYVTVGITILFGVAKYFNVGTADVDHLLDLLRQIGPLLVTKRGGAPIVVSREIEEATPNKVTRWLVG
jgi:hypothetical protein